MVIDFTAQLAPLLWGILGVLLIVTGGIVASIDPETSEVYLGDGRVLAVTAALATIALLVLIAVRPDIVSDLGIPLR